MRDIACPYCKEEQDICHDDGYGYDEGKQHEQHCVACGRVFKFTTSISFIYEVFCNGEHILEETSIKGFWECTDCDYGELRR